jgi:hypothetical protein
MADSKEPTRQGGGPSSLLGYFWVWTGILTAAYGAYWLLMFLLVHIVR